MRTYKPKRSYLAGALCITALFLGPCGYLCFWLWQHRGPRVDWNELCVFGFAILMLADFGLVFLYGCVQLTEWFQTDADGITRRAFWGARRLEWRNLARFEVVGESESDIALWDQNARRIEVSLSSLRNGDELREEIERRIESLREPLLRKWWHSGDTLRQQNPFSPAIEIFLVMLAALSGYGGFALLGMPGDAVNSRPVLITAAIFSFLFALLLVWLLVYIFTRTLKLNTFQIRAHEEAMAPSFG